MKRSFIKRLFGFGAKASPSPRVGKKALQSFKQHVSIMTHKSRGKFVLVTTPKGDVTVLEANKDIPRKVFQTLTLPGGRRIRVMREDAYQSAVEAASRSLG